MDKHGVVLDMLLGSAASHTLACNGQPFQAHGICCRDEDRGFQLYQSDPSGNYGGWKATAIGANKQGAQNLLKQDYADDITLDKATRLVIKARCCPS